MENSILKIKEKPLYTVDERIVLSDYLLCLKYFPKVYWSNVLLISIVILIICVVIAAYYRSVSTGITLFIILEIINLIEFTINFDKRMTKKFNKYIEKNDSLNHYDFYDDYLIISNEMLAKKFFYKDIVKFIETESNFYLEVRDNKGFIYIKKENASDELITFIQDKFAGLPLKKEADIVNKNKKKYQVILNALFCLTLLSVVVAAYLVVYLTNKYPSDGFYNLNYFGVAWYFLPIPLISIILSFKWEKRCNNHKNLVYGFLTIFLLGFMGAFSLLFNDEDIYRYNDIIGFTVPNSRLLGSNYSAFDGDKSEFKHITINYREENTDNLIEEIKNNSNWITDKEVVESLSLIIPLDSFVGDNTTYYLIYNETTKEYNKLPDDNGKYTISAIKYSDSSKILEFNSYTINYEK